jgi:hypothetical protein
MDVSLTADAPHPTGNPSSARESRQRSRGPQGTDKLGRALDDLQAAGPLRVGRGRSRGQHKHAVLREVVAAALHVAGA